MERQPRADAADVLAGVGRHWGSVLTFGIITLLAGLLAVVWPGRTVLVLAVLFGAQLVVAGIFRFVAALASDDERGGTRVLLVYPGISLLTLAVVLGVWLLVYGVMEIMLAFRLRSVGQAAARIAAAT